MTDQGAQMYRIAAVTGLGLNAFTTEQWKVLLEFANFPRSNGVVAPREMARVQALLEVCDELGILAEAEVVLSDVAGFQLPL